MDFINLNHYLSDGLFTSLCLIGIVILLYAVPKLKSNANVPPGPWGIPVFGYLPFLSKEPYKDFDKLSKKYGDIFSVQLGPSLVIILNSHEAMKKAFLKTEAFEGRPPVGTAKKLLGDGVIGADGALWKKQRRFLMSAMRDFGLGKSRMEEAIQNEIQIAAKSLQATNGKPYNVHSITENIACNAIAYFIFGQRFSAEDVSIKNALTHISKVADEINFMALYNAIPGIIKYIPDWLSGLKHLLDLRKQITNFVDEIIIKHEETFDENDPRDLIDVYLTKLRENRDHNDDIFKPDLLRDNTMNLFLAGTHSTNILMCWILRILAAYPDVQRKIQTELDKVVGRERLPSMKDKPNLTYTEAVILELYRYVTLVPMTIYHRVTEEIMLNGYRIPKDACCLGNIWSVHHSQDIWTEPNKFNPERFLDKNGKLIPKLIESVIPFSIGRRNCAGESIARMEVFLDVTTICQKFTLKLPEGEVWKFEPDKFIPVQRSNRNTICATPRL